MEKQALRIQGKFSNLSQDMKILITQLKCTQLFFTHLEDKGAILCLTSDTEFHQCLYNILYTALVTAMLMQPIQRKQY